MNTRREPGMGPAPATGARPVQVTVNSERRGGSITLFWLFCACLLLADLAILSRLFPLLFDLWTDSTPSPVDLALLPLWLLTAIAANLAFGIPALLARPR